MSSKIFMSVFVPWSIILPILIGLIQLKKLPYTGKIIWYYLLVAALVNFTASYIGRHLHKNNLPLIHLYTLVELVLFVWFYKHLLQAVNKKLYVILPIIFTALCIINALFFQNIFTYSSYTRSVEAFICILFALNYFARLATGTTEKKIITLPDFYFNTGIFLYFSGAFVLFVFSNFVGLTLSRADFNTIWVIHGGFLICMYLFFTAGFIVCKK
jgi:hypothetical protein